MYCKHRLVAEHCFLDRIDDYAAFEEYGWSSRSPKHRQIVVGEYASIPIDHWAVFTQDGVGMVVRRLEPRLEQLVSE